jgi:hypothetical protein
MRQNHLVVPELSQLSGDCLLVCGLSMASNNEISKSGVPFLEFGLAEDGERVRR